MKFHNLSPKFVTACRGKWHVLRYGTESGSDRAPTENPVATALGTVSLLLTRLAERTAVLERISIRALAEVQSGLAVKNAGGISLFPESSLASPPRVV